MKGVIWKCCCVWLACDRGRWRGRHCSLQTYRQVLDADTAEVQPPPKTSTETFARVFFGLNRHRHGLDCAIEEQSSVYFEQHSADIRTQFRGRLLRAWDGWFMTTVDIRGMNWIVVCIVY